MVNSHIKPYGVSPKMIPQAVNVNPHRGTHRESSQFSLWKRCDVSCTKSPFEVAQLEGICYSEWLLYLIYIYHLPSFSIIEVITISDISMEMGTMYTIEIHDAAIQHGVLESPPFFSMENSPTEPLTSGMSQHSCLARLRHHLTCALVALTRELLQRNPPVDIA